MNSNTHIEDWDFEQDDIVQEETPKFSPVPGEQFQPRKEYKIEKRFIDADTGEKYYYVEKPQGGTHVYAETVLNQYEKIPVEESKNWSKESEIKRV